jgi:formyltetrahydrofolate synthetase
MKVSFKGKRACLAQHIDTQIKQATALLFQSEMLHARRRYRVNQRILRPVETNRKRLFQQAPGKDWRMCSRAKIMIRCVSCPAGF